MPFKFRLMTLDLELETKSPEPPFEIVETTVCIGYPLEQWLPFRSWS